MAIQLSATAEAYLSNQTVNPNIVVEIQGFPYIFGAQAVLEAVTIGSFIIGDGTKIGGSSRREDSRDWIMLNGTTNNIGQQINIDRAEGSSITSFKVSLIDKNNEVTRLLSPGFNLLDPLGVEAKVYWMPSQAAFPRDAATLFIGVIDRLEFKQGSVVINVAHPDQLKRQDLLPKATAQLSTALLIGETTINSSTTSGFLPPLDSLVSYVRVNDEIIKFESTSSTEFLTCTRAQFGTIEADHELDGDIESFYVINGKPFETSLKILLSSDEEFFATRSAPRFVQIEPALNITNSIFFDNFNIQETLGLVFGDIVVISGAAEVANNVTTTITGFGVSSLGSYITVSADLVVEVESSASVSFKSQYNVLNFGCGLKSYQVDIEQFESLDLLVGSAFPSLSIYVKDTINASDFLDKELFFPFGIYSVPRKGRVSCNVTVPPIASANTRVLNETNITNAASLSVERTTNQRFYNAIVYKFSLNALDDRFLSARITQSAVSTNRVKVGNKFLTIESSGLRDEVSIQNFLDTQARRFLDRYQFGAEKIGIETNFKTGFPIEVGDTVILEAEALKLSDSKTGSRNFAPRVMEVTNKSINLKSGDVKLEVTDTGYSTNARYGTWAPSSIIQSEPSSGILRLQPSYSTSLSGSDSEKWRDYVGQKVIIRDSDWNDVQETTLVEVIETRPNEIRINPPVSNSFTDYIVDVPPYQDPIARDGRLYKALHCSWTRLDEIFDVAIDPNSFEVADASLYRVGNEIRIRDELYTRTFDSTILSINGNIITIREAPPFGFFAGDVVDFVGFGDGGNYYAFF
jgi:hypothetical protein